MCLLREDVLQHISCTIHSKQSIKQTYRTLAGIFPRIADMVGGQFDLSLVDGRQKRLCEGDFGHDVLLESRKQAFGGRGVQSRG